MFWPQCCLLEKSRSSPRGDSPQNCPFFGPPQRGWDLWFSLRSSVRSFVRSFVRPAEILKSVHRNFLIFGTKLGLPNTKEVTFSDFARKISFSCFWPILDKKWPFSAKNQRFAQFLKIYSLDLLSFAYLNFISGLI